MDENGEGNASDVKRAIDFATEEQIPILNYSGGGTKNHAGRRKAIRHFEKLYFVEECTKSPCVYLI